MYGQAEFLCGLFQGRSYFVTFPSAKGCPCFVAFPPASSKPAMANKALLVRHQPDSAFSFPLPIEGSLFLHKSYSYNLEYSLYFKVSCLAISILLAV